MIGPEGFYLAADGILTSVFRESVALSLQNSESGFCWISYFEDCEIFSSFDPLFPDGDYGARPGVLEQFTGRVAAVNAGDRAGVGVSLAGCGVLLNYG